MECHEISFGPSPTPCCSSSPALNAWLPPEQPHHPLPKKHTIYSIKKINFWSWKKGFAFVSFSKDFHEHWLFLKYFYEIYYYNRNIHFLRFISTSWGVIMTTLSLIIIPWQASKIHVHCTMYVRIKLWVFTKMETIIFLNALVSSDDRRWTSSLSSTYPVVIIFTWIFPSDIKRNTHWFFYIYCTFYVCMK